MTGREIIRVENLCKEFQVVRRRAGALGALKNLFAPQHVQVKAVDGVSFHLDEGEMVGYLGPNGAGKSTTLKMLTGLLVPTSGVVEVDGFIPWRERTRYVVRIGAVFGQRTTLWWDLPVIDSFELIQPMYRVPKERFRCSLAEFVGVLEMEPFINTPVRALSLGQRMRADLCAALLHEPRLVFLDEPTIGLDVVAKERIRAFIQHVHRERGVTVLLTTHDLSDVERLCERVMILDHGRLLYDGTLANLNQRFESDWSLVVTLENGAADGADLRLAGLEAPRRAGSQLIYRFDHRTTA
ncbi:MAG: ATP-binding cassette domain-containing protein, partial [Anaerolineaceae bacterium]|nr:ATP-binding cassette domain-containing protein [Anaerolineaceae bacterium]